MAPRWLVQDSVCVTGIILPILHIVDGFAVRMPNYFEEEQIAPRGAKAKFQISISVHDDSAVGTPFVEWDR